MSSPATTGQIYEGWASRARYSPGTAPPGWDAMVEHRVQAGPGRTLVNWFNHLTGRSGEQADQTAQPGGFRPDLQTFLAGLIVAATRFTPAARSARDSAPHVAGPGVAAIVQFIENMWPGNTPAVVARQLSRPVEHAVGRLHRPQHQSGATRFFQHVELRQPTGGRQLINYRVAQVILPVLPRVLDVAGPDTRRFEIRQLPYVRMPACRAACTPWGPGDPRSS